MRYYPGMFLPRAHRPDEPGVAVTLLDLANGQQLVVAGDSRVMWTEGGRACDCGRGTYFGVGRDTSDCVGSLRWAVTGVDDLSAAEVAEFNTDFRRSERAALQTASESGLWARLPRAETAHAPAGTDDAGDSGRAHASSEGGAAARTTLDLLWTDPASSVRLRHMSLRAMGTDLHTPDTAIAERLSQLLAHPHLADLGPSPGADWMGLDQRAGVVRHLSALDQARWLGVLSRNARVRLLATVAACRAATASRPEAAEGAPRARSVRR